MGYIQFLAWLTRVGIRVAQPVAKRAFDAWVKINKKLPTEKNFTQIANSAKNIVKSKELSIPKEFNKFIPKVVPKTKLKGKKLFSDAIKKGELSEVVPPNLPKVKGPFPRLTDDKNFIILDKYGSQIGRHTMTKSIDRTTGKGTTKWYNRWDDKGQKLQNKLVRVEDETGKTIIDSIIKGGKTSHASGGIAGQLHMNRQGYEGGKIVEGKGIYEPPQNKYGIGLTSILEDVMRDAPKKGTWNEKDLEYIWDIMQGEHDIENIEDELMLRFGRMNPEKKSKFFAEIGKGKVGFGWKKQFASGGLAGQLHMNQGGAAWPAGRERFSEEWNLTDAYKEMLDTRLSAMEVSSTPPDQQDIDSISNYYNNLKEKGVDTTKFDKRIQNLLQPPKPSSGLSHILGV